MEWMDEKQFMEIGTKLAVDPTTIELQMDMLNGWVLVSALQLATRHPEMSGVMKQMLTKLGRGIQGRIAEKYPDAGKLLEKGWHKQFDK